MVTLVTLLLLMPPAPAAPEFNVRVVPPVTTAPEFVVTVFSPKTVTWQWRDAAGNTWFTQEPADRPPFVQPTAGIHPSAFLRSPYVPAVGQPTTPPTTARSAGGHSTSSTDGYRRANTFTGVRPATSGITRTDCPT